MAFVDLQISCRYRNQKLSVDNGYLTKVPFDLERWQQVAAEEYPNGLPEPHSDDPTQWLFKGHPKGSTDPLQVAVARLLGYRWPTRSPTVSTRLADADGIVPIPAVRGESPAAERLLEVLRAAFGPEWSSSLLDRLADRGRLPAGDDARRLAPQQLLRAALQAVPQPPLPLAHLGRPQGRLLLPGQLPQAEPQGAGEPDLLLPARLDQRPGRRREGKQVRGRPAAERRPGRCRTSSS